jgi:hypothetical protein
MVDAARKPCLNYKKGLDLPVRVTGINGYYMAMRTTYFIT